jgi:vacuolar-type H+-ATPase subunit F/Vma7
LARLVIITTPELTPGYRLAGVTTLTAASPREASAIVRELVDGGEKGVIGLYAPYWAGMDRDLRRRLERMVNPVVIAMPAGRLTGGAGERRATIAAMLRRVVGYHITLSDESEPAARTARPRRE